MVGRIVGVLGCGCVLSTTLLDAVLKIASYIGSLSAIPLSGSRLISSIIFKGRVKTCRRDLTGVCTNLMVNNGTNKSSSRSIINVSNNSRTSFVHML